MSVLTRWTYLVVEGYNLCLRHCVGGWLSFWPMIYVVPWYPYLWTMIWESRGRKIFCAGEALLRVRKPCWTISAQEAGAMRVWIATATLMTSLHPVRQDWSWAELRRLTKRSCHSRRASAIHAAVPDMITPNILFPSSLQKRLVTARRQPLDKLTPGPL